MAQRLNEMAARLLQTRLALGYPQQAAFCRELGVPPNQWNQYETGARRITMPVAQKLKRRFGVSLDWTYDGDVSNLPHGLATSLFRKAAE